MDNAQPASTAVKAVALWEELTGQAVSSTSYSFKINGDSFSLHAANERVKQALKIADDVTTTLIIKTLANDFAASEKFTLADILSGNERLQARIELIERFNALFNEPQTKAKHDDFYGYCEGALAHYRGKEVQDADKQFIRDSACFVGLDAYYSMDRLTRLMISDGPLGDVTNPKVNQFIYAYDSIEQLISQATQIPTGFSLCAILAPHISDSYFVMVVRNGGRTLVLSDKGNYEHPLQAARMRERNDRYNLYRIERSHFPYSLLQIDWRDSGRTAGKGVESATLPVADTGIQILGSLSSLDTWDMLWLHLFIDQCRHRYFENEQTEPPLAVGSMIKLPHKWLPGNATLPVPAEYELKLDTRASKDLTTAFMHSIEPKWANKPNKNRWMEERFAALVPDEALYIPALALNDTRPALTYQPEALMGPTLINDSEPEPKAEWAAGMSLATRLKLEREKGLPARPMRVDLVPLAETALSTPERVRRDAHFIARHNQAQVIKQLAERDYELRKADVAQWWYKACANNLPNIIDDLLALNHERFQFYSPALLKTVMAMPHTGMTADEAAQWAARNARHAGHRAIQIEYKPVRSQYALRREGPPSLAKALKLENYAWACTRCAVDREEDAQLFIRLETKHVLDLLLITGLSLDKIPPELHYRGMDGYAGNSILDRLDPLAVLRNPWRNLDLYFVLPVSIKAFKAARRRMGLETPRASELELYAKTTGEPTRPMVSDDWYSTPSES